MGSWDLILISLTPTSFLPTNFLTPTPSSTPRIILAWCVLVPPPPPSPTVLHSIYRPILA